MSRGDITCEEDWNLDDSELQAQDSSYHHVVSKHTSVERDRERVVKGHTFTAG